MIERFWKKVDKSGGCWEWTSDRDKCGYGRFSIYGTSCASPLAHRIAWELTKGAIPQGMHVLHCCDNPGCVNPDHLFLGTHQDNMKDKVKKNRQARGSSRKGAKLHESDIPRIRDMLRCGARQRDIAKWFGVGKTTIGNINLGQKWAHIK